MAHVYHNGKLNQLLIDLSRSLLQYVGQCSSWASRDEAVMERDFAKIVATQEHHVAELVELLMQRHWTIDFGGFPATYTDLHFLSLDYLVKLIVKDQKPIVAELDESLHNCVDDPEAAALIGTILASERQITEQLEKMANPATAA